MQIDRTERPQLKAGRVVLVGTHPTTMPEWEQHYRPGDELWSLNEAYLEPMIGSRINEFSGWFQLHDQEMWWDNPKDPHHLAWLEGRDPATMVVYLQKTYENIPASWAYPRSLVRKVFPDAIITSTFDWMVALAMTVNLKQVAVCGFEAAGDTEYRYQKEGMRQWLGIVQGRGCLLILPEASRLHPKWWREYGYEGLPHLTFEQLKKRLKMLTEKRKEAEKVAKKNSEDSEAFARYYCWDGAILHVRYLLGRDDLPFISRSSLEGAIRDLRARQLTAIADTAKGIATQDASLLSDNLARANRIAGGIGEATAEMRVCDGRIDDLEPEFEPIILSQGGSDV